MLQKKLWSSSWVIFGVMLITFQSNFAQEMSYCGTQGIDLDWANYLKEHKDLDVRSSEEEIFVPITVHVVGNDMGQGYHTFSSIFRSMTQLNIDFAETNIRFFMSGPLNYINKTSWYDHTSFGVGSQMMNANNVANTINCYIVENAADNCGYRSFNGDAIALTKSCTQPNDHTWAHEMGHWLGLPHTFFGWEGKTYDDEEATPANLGSRKVEKADGSNCSEAADRVCDTPADYLSFRWGCDDNNEYPDSLRDPDGVRFAVDGSLFMSYAFDDCQSRFSEGQTVEMRSYLTDWVPEVVSDDEPMLDVIENETRLVFPVGGELVEDKVTLKWEEDGSANFYIVEVSIVPSMTLLSLREIVYGTSLDVFGLSPDKDYYWRLRPMNYYDFEYTNNTDVESFKTGELSSTDDYYAENLNIYPNPISRGNSVYLNLYSDNSENVIIDITNLEGRSVMRAPFFINNGSNRLELNTSSLSSGVYILRGIGELHNFRKKIVVE